MNLKTISLGISGFGTVLFLFAVIMWATNKPDFDMRSICGMFGSPGNRAYQECVTERTREFSSASALYTNCLFSSRYQLCQSVTAVPYLSIGGLMILLAGGGLFVFARNRSST